jgi:DNA-binding transcriptional regulator YhcF (GntR family)
MQGKIDTSFQTLQRDLFNSGMAAHIGMNAFGVWLAIKNHADYNTGECWPGMRRLAELTGLAVGSVQKATKALVEAKLLRIDQGKRRRGCNTYVARERMDVKLGDRVLCTIVLDYVPRSLKQRLNEIEQSLQIGEKDPELWAHVEIIPGPGFLWDPTAGVLRTTIHASEFPSAMPDATQEQLQSDIVKRLLAIKNRAEAVDK